MKKKNLLIFFVCIAILNISAQDYPVNDFTSPVKGQLSLSSDFGEIRPNHFHAGLDIRLKTGQPVYSVADGYISRIKVQTGGYGKALYVNHYNGYRSVYAHLDAFIPEVEKYIKQIQKNNHSFNTVKYPDTTMFPVRKGQLIAYGGNTGRSYGAHLHFEIRERENDIPVNPYLFGYKVYDNKAPDIYHIQISPGVRTGSVAGGGSAIIYKLDNKGNSYYPLKKITASGKIGISVQALDRKPGLRNRYAVYTAEVFENEKLIFSFTKDYISFYETRYLNSYIDYNLKQTKNTRYTDLFAEKGNQLSIYNNMVDRGYINIKAGEKKKIRIVLSDFSGNKSQINFIIYGEHYSLPSEEKCMNTMKACEENFFVKDEFRLISDETSFYSDFCLEYEKIKTKSSYLYSDVHKVHNKTVPIHDNVFISIRAKDVEPRIYDKLCLVRKSKKGYYQYVGGGYINGFVSGKIRQFGEYAVRADISPPSIKAKNFSDSADIRDLKYLEFDVSDNLSGIYSYTAIVDGEQVTLFYDLKSNTLYYKPQKIVGEAKMHNMKITVFDKKANKSVYIINYFK